MKKQIIEIRIITHTPGGVGPKIVVLFDDETSSAFHGGFDTYEHAVAFRNGMINAARWVNNGGEFNLEKIGD